MFNDFANVATAKDVNASPVLIAGLMLNGVQHNQVALSHRTLEVHALARILAGHSFKVSDERLLIVCDFPVSQPRLGGAWLNMKS